VATLKQKAAVKKLLENKGMAVSVAMMTSEVPYTPATAKNPKELTDSNGWKELMAKYLPDDKLAKKHQQFLNSEKEEIGVKALDMGYKLKGAYAPDRNINLNLAITQSDEVIEDLAERLEQLEVHQGTDKCGDGVEAKSVDNKVPVKDRNRPADRA